MKFINHLATTLLFALLLALTSCDSDSIKPDNYVRVAGSTYKLSSGIMVDEGSTSLTSNGVEMGTVEMYSIYLFSEDIISLGGGELAGTGNVVYLQIALPEGYENGLYATYDMTPEINTPHILDGVVGINVNVQSSEPNGKLYRGLSGTLKITEGSKGKRISFNFNSSEGTSMSGVFESELTIEESSYYY